MNFFTQKQTSPLVTGALRRWERLESCLFLFTNLRVAECFAFCLKIAIDGTLVSGTRFLKIFFGRFSLVYLLRFIIQREVNVAQTRKVLRATRVIKNKKKDANWKKSFEDEEPKNKNLVSARTFQCDNEFKTELTGSVEGKEKHNEKEKYLSN